MKQICTTVLACILYSSFCVGQNTDWRYYFAEANVHLVAETDSAVWMGTFWYGLVRYDKNSQQLDFINKTNSGLHDYYIQDLAADHSKNLWVISSGVLQCYTGSQWITYDSANCPIRSTVNNVFVDEYDNKWISTNKGFFRYNNLFWTEFHCPGAYDAVGKICTDASGTVYAICNGLSILKNNVWQQYSFDDYPDNVTGITDMQADAAGNLWMVSYHGLEKFKDGNFTVWNMSNSNLPTTKLNCVAIDQHGVPWIGFGEAQPWNGWYGGILSFSQNSFQLYDDTNTPVNTVSVLDMEFGSNWKMWAAGGDGYLISLEGNTWSSSYVSNSSFTHYMLNKVFLDGEQHPYVLNFNSGDNAPTIHKFDFTKWAPVTNHHYGPAGITADHQNRIWMKNYLDSLVILDSGVATTIWSPPFHTYGAWNGSPANRSVMFFDRNGNLWVDYADSTVFWYDPYWQTGYWYYVEGLAKFDGSNWTYFTKLNSTLSGGDIYDVKDDPSGNIWVYEYGGLMKFDGSNWEKIENQPWQNYSAVGSIAVDSIGNLWTSDGHNGLAKYNGTSWEIFPNDIFGEGVSQFANLTIDHDGSLWGNYTFWVFHFDGLNWTYFTPENSPIQEANILSIVIDSFGNKYFATGVGLFVYRDGGIYYPVPVDTTGIPTDTTLISPDSIFAHMDSSFLILPSPGSDAFDLYYLLPQLSNVKIEIFDISGQQVDARDYAWQTEGKHIIHYSSQGLTSGVYYIRFTAADKMYVKKWLNFSRKN